MDKSRNSLFIVGFFLALFYVLGCDNKPEQKQLQKTIDYIRPITGKNDSLSTETIKKGEVLINYSDCYICHKNEQRSVGPAFQDIAKRYPANKDYIEMLAHKVIIGGRGSWGYPIMDPHPDLTLEDAQMMVTYIMSMKK